MPAGQRIPAPAQIDSLIQQDTAVSKDISLLNTNGSEVLLGNVLTIPLDQSLLYVRPLYVSSKANGQALPELKRVIVVYNNNVYYENTLQEALQDAFPGLAQITQEQNVGQGSPTGAGTGTGTTPTTTPGSGTTGTTVPGAPTTTLPIGTNLTVSQLLTQAQQEFTAADAALAKNPPDFAGYEQHIQRAQSLITRATQEAGVSTTTTPASGATTTTSTTSASTTSTSVP
jgi:hypothetical protein